MHIFRVTDGKLAEHWAVHDDLGVLRQIESPEPIDTARDRLRFSPSLPA